MIESKIIVCFCFHGQHSEIMSQTCNEIACYFQTTTRRPYTQKWIIWDGVAQLIRLFLKTFDCLANKVLATTILLRLRTPQLDLAMHWELFFFLYSHLKQTIILEFLSFISKHVLQCHLGDLDGKYSWKTFKLQLRLIALDQPEYYQDWSIVKHSNVFFLRCVLCVVQPGGSREDACEALGALKR